MLDKGSDIPLKTKCYIYIYKTYIRPIITYAIRIWTSNISWTEIEKIQSKILRPTVRK